MNGLFQLSVTLDNLLVESNKQFLFDLRVNVFIFMFLTPGVFDREIQLL